MVYCRPTWGEPVRVAPEIVLTSQERAGLTKLVRSKLTSVRLAQRARIVLLALQGMQSKDIAVELGIELVVDSLENAHHRGNPISPVYQQRVN